MTVKYNLIERANPLDREAPKKWYPSIQASGRITTRNLAERASQMSTLTTADIMAVIESLLTIIPDELSKGNIVELGDFGSFWLRINAEGAENEGMVRTSNIQNVLPRFTPGKEFKKALETIVFSKN